MTAAAHPGGECPICAGSLRPALRWSEPPPGETAFELPGEVDYAREFRRCERCGHFAAVSDLDLGSIYDGAYVDATYSTADGVAAAYERIMALPPERSDNSRRVARVQRFAEDRAAGGSGGRTLLDVGSGLGVFPARMKELGWSVTALDPDARAVEHAREAIGVAAIQADFMQIEPPGTFDLITFNKILEHVPDPIAMLERSAPMTSPDGAVYVEVPDGEAAQRAPEGAERREEFFIEHLHCFSAASVALLADRAGFALRRLERVREPSGKYTLAAFLEPLGLD